MASWSGAVQLPIGGAGAATCYKKEVASYFAHVKKLAAKTGGCVNTFVKKATGAALW